MELKVTFSLVFCAVCHVTQSGSYVSTLWIETTNCDYLCSNVIFLNQALDI